MSGKYLAGLLSRKGPTPQNQAIPGREADMSPNHAGGVTFTLDQWGMLDRFLILGSEGGTYYQTQQTLSLANAKNLQACVKADGLQVVRRIVEISQAGRAPKNDPAIFALAVAASFGNDATRTAALQALPQVCRIGTHLFHFAAYIDGMRGWGRGLRKAVANWYTSKEAGKLGYQLVKYQQRDGWSHRDLLRLSHPKVAGSHQTLLHWAVKGWEGVGEEPHPDSALQQVWAFERAKRATTATEICTLIQKYRLPREAIPTQFLNDKQVWEALLVEMPLNALVRNLGKLTAIGILSPLSEGEKDAVSLLQSPEALKRSRLHPYALLVAAKMYARGQGLKGDLRWTPSQRVLQAIETAFYQAFDNVTPTGKRFLLALDVSGSMGTGFIGPDRLISAREASGVMALVTARTEPQHHVIGFTGGSRGFMHRGNQELDAVSALPIRPNQSFREVLETISGLPFGGTDCALPMLYATAHQIPVDAFVVYTDNETWAGNIQPKQALDQYRQKTGIPAKLIVVGMTATQCSIADPQDPGMLDVVGFDSATPQVLSAFVNPEAATPVVAEEE
jgi:60 kDa SS-A/Ro ribonucleoprotein